MKRDSKILIAGCSGMVGCAILKRLLSLGFKNIMGSYLTHKPKANDKLNVDGIRLIQIDLRRQSKVEAFFERERPQYVFLAAAKVGGILANSIFKAEFIYDNTMIAANVIHASYKNNVKKLLNLGSSCIYPKFAPQPMKEKFLLSGELEPTNEPYAIAKIAAIKLCRYYNEQFETNFISVMPANLYGPNDNFNLETSHVLPAILRKFHLAKLLKKAKKDKKYYIKIIQDIKNNSLGYNFNIDYSKNCTDDIEAFLEKVGITEEHVMVWGKGEVYREFLYVDDLADASIFLMKGHNHQEIGEFINIGTGEEIKIKDLAEIIKNVVSYNGRIRYDCSKPEGTPRKRLDISRMQHLGWAPKLSLKDGIEMTYRRYISGLTDA
ncbi:MAG TPA: GDP-L-fucose synthase [Desulfobacterales bacterium]|nr:GDP-L-fucose synthase [Desulfobacterales bacterium]